MNANAEMRMPLLDMAFYLLDSDHSPQDFTLILHLRNPPSVDRLQAGATSAINRFPKSGSCIERNKWVWREDTQFKVSDSPIENFIDEPFDLRQERPVRQALISDGTGTRLVTRFHHAAADGLSAALWLGHQLNVAYGVEAVERERAPFVEVPLHRLPMSVRRSMFAFDKASDPLWTSQSERSGSRRWLTIGFPASDLQKACRQAAGFTYNDLLATCTLELFSQWNSICRGGTPWPPDLSNSGDLRAGRPDNKRIGLWIPMNIRRESSVGFGNGTSRIRLYARYKPAAPLVEKAREVRRQVSWTSNTANGSCLTSPG